MCACPAERIQTLYFLASRISSFIDPKMKRAHTHTHDYIEYHIRHDSSQRTELIATGLSRFICQVWHSDTKWAYHRRRSPNIIGKKTKDATRQRWSLAERQGVAASVPNVNSTTGAIFLFFPKVALTFIYRHLRPSVAGKLVLC